MEIQTLNRMDLVARGWSTAQIKALAHVGVVKTNKRGRPAKLYSLEAVEAAEAMRAAAPDSSVEVAPEGSPEVSTENEPVAVAA